jgi:hypothetical protein
MAPSKTASMETVVDTDRYPLSAPGGTAWSAAVSHARQELKGKSHPWHFDTNEFTISMLTQAPLGGGVFEYCPEIRSPQAENFDDVGAVLPGKGDHLVRRLQLRAGDLQLFRGRHALHRVTAVEGQRERHSAVFAFSAQPGVVGTVARTKQPFGRVLPAHLATAGAGRGDLLLD